MYTDASADAHTGIILMLIDGMIFQCNKPPSIFLDLKRYYRYHNRGLYRGYMRIIIGIQAPTLPKEPVGLKPNP